MTRVSAQLAWPVVGVAVLAAVPIWLHATAAPTFEPCANAPRIFELDRIGTGSVTERKPDPAGRVGAGIVDGQIRPLPAGVRALEFRVHRSFDPHRFFGTKSVLQFDWTYSRDQDLQLTPLEADGGPFPSWWTEEVLGTEYRVRAHANILNGRPVESVFLEGIALAAAQLVSGTRPVTQLVVRAEGHRTDAEAMRRAAREWLRSAWELYEQTCGAP